MERIYNKLVRDNIPNIIRKNNETPIIRVLNEPYKDIPMKSIAFSFGAYVYIRKKNAMQ